METRPRKIPILGNNFPGDTNCTRMIVNGKCNRPGVWHIVWQDYRASVACAECGKDVLEKYVYVELHELTGPCTSPGGVWIEEDHKCVFPKTDEDFRRGRFLIGF